MVKILFVCTGNTCRSPMAEFIANKISSDNNFKILASSRGTSVFDSSISFFAKDVLVNEFNIVNIFHESKFVTIDDIINNNYILTMTSAHKNYLYNFAPTYKKKIFTISEFSKLNNLDILDPYGGDYNMYKNCANELFVYINKILNDLYTK